MLTQTRGDVKPTGPSPVRRRPWWTRPSSAQVLMVVAGILAFLVNLVILRGADEVVAVAVAADDLQSGTVLSAADLSFVDIDAASGLAESLVTRAGSDDVVGRVLVAAVRAGDPIPRSAVRSSPSSRPLRAFSIPVDRHRAAGGDLEQGDVVDVISVEGGVARYVLVGAEVVAVPARQASGLSTAGPFHVVVAATSDEALAVAAALGAGPVDVVRSTGAAAPTRMALGGGA